MAEDGLRLGGLSSGLALILNGEDSKENSSKTHLVSSCDEFGYQSVERTLEYVFGLPNRSIGPVSGPVDGNVVRSILKNEFGKLHVNLSNLVGDGDRDGICVYGSGGRLDTVGLDEISIRGDIRIIKPPLLIESLAMFSSARANAAVWKGKWMYEVFMETAGIQQLGWATVSCPFTDHKGVGDADDSYAFDGRRVRKWNKDAELYGQSWVVGDVIGCCIDLDCNEISFYRNGVSLGVAFHGIRKMGVGCGYFPAISLSQAERCELNFGGRPFKFPIEGYHPLQAPPSIISFTTQLLRCLSRLLGLHSVEQAKHSSVEKLRLKRFVSLSEILNPASHGICEELFSALGADVWSIEYVAWGPFLSFIMEVFGLQVPHDYSGLDRVLDVFLEFNRSQLLFEHVINALACGCKTAPLILKDCPCSGSYPYLALACHILRRQELMVLWWKSPDFEYHFEGFLSRKDPNKNDLESIMPSVWWPGSCEDVSYESSMLLMTRALSEAVSKIEEKHRNLCRLVIQFIPPVTPPQLPGSVFRTFLQNLLLKNRGADHNLPPPGVSSNSVLVSLYTVILHFLSEGFGVGEICGWLKGSENGRDVGFLHRGGQRSFPVGLFFRNDPHRNDNTRLGGSFSHLSKSQPADHQEVEDIRWEEGCMDDEETRVTHLSTRKPCCCSSYDDDFTRKSRYPIRYIGRGSQVHCRPMPERSSHVTTECSAGSLSDEIADKPSSSYQSESDFSYCPVQHTNFIPREGIMSSATLREEELLDVLLLLYHIGLAPNFKQASYYMNHQLQSIANLEETDKKIREGPCFEQLKHLKEARNVHREEVIDSVRQCAWYRISLSSRWKLRGMYATCMWTVQLLLVLSKVDLLFTYVPEYYLEALVDCFHVLRKCDPPFVPSSIFIKQGLASFITFVVTHFNDPRISSADLRDLLLQSISVLVQYKEYLAAFESNDAVKQRMPKALLSAFDNRSWIPVTNILLRLCKGSGFGSSKHGESSSSSSIIFQRLLGQTCISDEGLFSAFLNRLFNTLSWTMTEFSVSVREMQEKYQVLEFQQKKCSVIYDLSCNLARVLEFCTHEIPQAFLSGADTNLRRLTELIVFILNHITSAEDSEFFDLSLRRHGQSLEKVNRGMVLAPLVGIILNLIDASEQMDCKEHNDVVSIFASMGCLDSFNCRFQYLLDYNWAGTLRGDSHLGKLTQLENFLNLILLRSQSQENKISGGETDVNDDVCCICYASEADARFGPCSHRSCYGCITRHLLNCHRCFFCNATVVDVVRVSDKAD
ncbi:E3 ubiquitin-protein ligase RKP [Argentina anserina]|uniref:E3 ubiquitin-protein ligase RKP n=1 Tax=Argentina anserina TaxID=57926 RepID=UPI0021767881|nr:E3 ubiquitin-protein ligase RKP [Potentilla anserina]